MYILLHIGPRMGCTIRNETSDQWLMYMFWWSCEVRKVASLCFALPFLRSGRFRCGESCDFGVVLKQELSRFKPYAFLLPPVERYITVQHHTTKLTKGGCLKKRGARSPSKKMKRAIF